ncbi:cupredoxin domain-containing protein [Neorhodopirellula pilleata]|nr:hypothetical protein [Neorhodopirellula pilleata]
MGTATTPFIAESPIKEVSAYVVGDDFQLFFRYPGADGIMFTPDDRQGVRNWIIPSGANVRLWLTSRDFAYLVEIPETGLYEVAAPGLVFEASFKAPASGQYELLGSQMCGYDHPNLLGRMIVLPSPDFARSMANLPTAQPLTAPPWVFD